MWNGDPESGFDTTFVVLHKAHWVCEENWRWYCLEQGSGCNILHSIWNQKIFKDFLAIIPVWEITHDKNKYTNSLVFFFFLPVSGGIGFCICNLSIILPINLVGSLFLLVFAIVYDVSGKQMRYIVWFIFIWAGNWLLWKGWLCLMVVYSFQIKSNLHF